MTKSSAASIQFLGAAGTVTGSKYLVTFQGRHVLVDCGLFQGLKNLRLRNWKNFPVDPSSIEAVILTHAHLDHSGYLPRLVREGFRGRIYATPATKDLCAILLPDSGYLQEEDARYMNKGKLSKHSPALPLYTAEDAEETMRFFETVDFKSPLSLAPDWEVEFFPNGHILGSAMVSMRIGRQHLVFSGDVGRPHDPVLYPPHPVPPADYLILESTYGNRSHGDNNVLDRLHEVVERTWKRDGVLLIPAFAVGRAQHLMVLLSQLKKQGRLPSQPIYLNSPMATSVTALLSKYHDLHRLTPEECQEACDLVKYVRSPEESKDLNEKKGPMIIISASGMLAGGRILHHMKAFAPDPRSTILLTGFQAAGSRGRTLLDGGKEVKIHGQYVPVRAEVVDLENLSAHADYRELIDWLAKSPDLRPRQVFMTHGEPSAADDLRRRVAERFDWSCVVPEEGEVVSLRP